MIDPFLERTDKSQSKKGKRISGGTVETSSQKISEDKSTKLEVDNHRSPVQDDNRAGRGTEGNGNRRLTNEPTP